MANPTLQSLTLGQLLDRAVAAHPDREAVVYVDRDFPADLPGIRRRGGSTGQGPDAPGVQKGEKVAVWATNVPYWVALQFATAKIGAVLLTVNTNYKSSELAYLLEQSEAENLFLIDGFRDTDYVATLYELVPELRTQERGHTCAASVSPSEAGLLPGPGKAPGHVLHSRTAGPGAHDLPADYLARQAELDPHDVVNMQYTSGTTGFPKGVMLTHHNIANNGFWIGENQLFTHKDRICLPVPLFHCFGCVLGVLAAVPRAPW
jgi:fatty-acyl-CoA synthase